MQTTLTRAELEAHDPEGGRGGRYLCPLPACAGHTDPRAHRSIKLESSGLWHCHRCKASGQLKDHWKERGPWVPMKEKARQERARRDALTAQRIEEIAARFKRLGPPVAVSALVAGSVTGEALAAPPALQLARQDDQGALDPYRAGKCEKLDAPGEGSHLRPEVLGFLAARGLDGEIELLSRARVRYARDFGRRRSTAERGAWGGAPALVFPIQDTEGKLIAVTGRLIAPRDDQPKALTFGPKSQGLFWAPGALDAFRQGKPLAVCEAPLDALTLALCDVPAVAVIGTDGAPEFLQRGAFGRRFWLAFDADQAGDTAAEKLGELLRSRGALVERLRPEGVKDWNEALQTGGSVWERTAARLRALIARESIASTAEALPAKVERIEPRGGGVPLSVSQLNRVETKSPSTLKRIETGSGAPELSTVVGEEGGGTAPELGQVGTQGGDLRGLTGTSELAEVGRESATLERTRTESALYTDSRQEVLSWALGEAERGLLLVNQTPIKLPSGQQVPPLRAAQWLQDGQERAERLRMASARSVDSERAFLILRQDLRALALQLAEGWRSVFDDAGLIALGQEVEELLSHALGELPQESARANTSREGLDLRRTTVTDFLSKR